MKLSSQIKFIATIFVVLISINQINGYVHKIPERKRLRLPRETGTELSDPITVSSVKVIDGSAGDPLLNPAHSETETVDPKLTTTHKPRNNKPKEAELEPPEKTWKALQIFGIGMFIIVVAYYINKLRKKFERDNDDDML